MGHAQPFVGGRTSRVGIETRCDDVPLPGWECLWLRGGGCWKMRTLKMVGVGSSTEVPNEDLGKHSYFKTCSSSDTAFWGHESDVTKATYCPFTPFVRSWANSRRLAAHALFAVHSYSPYICTPRANDLT